MSAAASAPLPIRKVTRGYAQVPNAFIENLHHFTPAEQSLALIILRRGGSNVGVPISDEVWTAWTGLKARAKEYAVKGLAEKCLDIEGRGSDARFVFRRSRFEEFVRFRSPGATRTAGRKLVRAVPARPGAMVHPECADKGCSMMLAETRGCTLVPAPNAQPVAQNSGAGAGPKSVPVPGSNLRVIPLGSSRVAQPVARNVAAVWPKTLAKVQSLFPLADEVFLAQLVGLVSGFRGLTDAQLCDAVETAWKLKRKVQHSEGLFLWTVPKALKVLRDLPAAEEYQAPDVRDGVKRLLTAAAESLRGHGDVFAGEVKRIEKLGRELSASDLDEWTQAEGEMERIENDVIRIGFRLLDDRAAEITAAEDRVERLHRQQSKVSADSISPSLIADLRATARKRTILELLNVPRLSAFYA